MGLYDRDYVRGREPGFFLGGDRTAVTDLILVNVGVFLLDMFFQGRLADDLSLQLNLFSEPWRFYELLTYGFVHDPASLMHLFFNMFALWLFGRDVEAIYGRTEFLRLYISLVILCGVAWAALQFGLIMTDRRPTSGAVIGASGAVLGVMVVYCTYYPRRIFLIWGILPMPAWLMCVLFIFMDLIGFGAANVAHEVHLAGAAFGFLYRQTGWNWGTVFSGKWWRKLRLPRRSHLHVHQPTRDEPDDHDPVHDHDVRDEAADNDKVDRILAKISQQGEGSLTRDERRILEDASRRYQQRRR